MHPNEKVLRDAIGARAAGDDELLAAYVDRDALTHFPGRSLLAGDLRGRGALGAKAREITGHPLDIDVHDVLAWDERRRPLPDERRARRPAPSVGGTPMSTTSAAAGSSRSGSIRSTKAGSTNSSLE